jgi:hypothetical protein
MSPSLRRIGAALAALILLSVSCRFSMPSLLPAQPTPTPQPLPPALVETEPAAGSQVPLDKPISLYFNQAMDKTSVEAAFSVQPQVAGSFAWPDEATLVFTPDSPLSPESSLAITIATSAKASNGMAFLTPAEASFTTAGYLRLTQALPDTGSVDALPTGAVTASFNQPVVPLGAESSTLPAGFTLSPEAAGRGEWLNTSTYAFYPEPGLNGGAEYTASLNPDLVSTAGAPLAPDSGATTWSFTTALPRLVFLEPTSETHTPLDAVFKLTFNEPMDPASVEAAFSLADSSGRAVPGEGSWDDKSTVYSFTPDEMLARGTDYTLALGVGASARGGTPLAEPQTFALRTYSDLAVTFTQPGEGLSKPDFESLVFHLASPLRDDADYTSYVSITPKVPFSGAYFSEDALWVYGNFTPSTEYTATLSSQLTDKWGGKLDQPYTLNFRTDPARPSLNLPYVSSNSAFFVRPEESSIQAQATNITSINVGLAPVSLEDFIRLTGPEGYNLVQTYSPQNYRTWTQPVNLPANQSQSIAIDFSPEGGDLAPGLYYGTISAPQVEMGEIKLFLAVGDVNLTFKAGPQDALTWALDLRTGEPMPNADVTILDANGETVASGRTDADGLWQADVDLENLDRQDLQVYYAVVAAPGDADFSISPSNWNVGVAPWDAGYPTDFRGEHPFFYTYTDRPMYRAGQTVYFRGVARNRFDGRYTPAAGQDVSFTLYSPDGSTKEYTLPLSAYGTFDGELSLPESAQPGYYSASNEDYSLQFYFQVAEYRKPEINLSVQIDPEETLAENPPAATVSAQYYFGAPAGNLPVTWTLNQSLHFFGLPGYQVGATDPYTTFTGESLASGEAVTAPDGTLSIPLENLPMVPSGLELTLEVTAQDESGFPVSARDSFILHPAEFYIGISPDSWNGQAGSQMGFGLIAVDWEDTPLPGKALQVDFQEAEYEFVDPDPNNPYDNSYKATYTTLDSETVTTGADGTARAAFTPPAAGTYRLSVSSGDALSESMLWVGGPEQAVWPTLNDKQVRLVADRDSYEAGDTAKVFIPNPLGVEVPALVTVERGTISDARVISLPAGGGSVSIPLTAESAPNVYVSVTLAGSGNDFRQGYTSLDVSPAAETLNVEVTSDPERAGPGDDVTFDVRVTDAGGGPVQGEFSFAVVDLAALALAEPNATDILSAFYASQPVGVQTSISLSAHSGISEGGRGGGGGGDGSAPQVVRENFPDTAYWSASVITDADGRATVKMKLPDNLTTWHVLARGLTADTRVGEDTDLLVTTKDLLIRPVTPRFLVVGDHAELSAVVNNNTASDISAEVSLEAHGFTLDDASSATQQVDVPAGGRARVAWPGLADNSDSAELVFSVKGGGLQDAATPSSGALPILHYTAPQAFVSSGLMPDGGTNLEIVSLPRSFTPTGGRLDVELAPSLGYSILQSALEAGYPKEIWSVDQLVSYVLPALASQEALKSAGALSAEDAARLDANITDAIQQIIGFQNGDGGWGWCRGCKSDVYESSYALMALQMAQDAGYTVSANVLQNARAYVGSARPLVGSTALTWQLDRAAFADYVLQISGGSNPANLNALYDERGRLSPWAQALLALAIRDADSADARANEILSNLETTSIRTSSGVHWESDPLEWHNPGTPIFTTSVVLYALAESGASTPLAADALRYVASNRDANGWWDSAHDSAWAAMASSSAVQDTGDLNASFTFSSELNGQSLASGAAAAPSGLEPASATAPISDLYFDAPNALTFNREAGEGTLFYRAALHAERPVESAPPLSAGMTVSREYVDASCEEDCPAIDSIALEAGAQVQARVTLTLPNDAYYLALEDYIPAGAEILNTALLTTAQAEGSGVEVQQNYDPEDPYAGGWGWWLFNPAQIYDDHITFTADYLPAGTYVLTYTLIPLQTGEYQVLPARAWQTYFPEVQATSAGARFEIK